MDTHSFSKIAVVGNAGSGKTTLSFQLHKKLNLPLYHLDKYYWKPNWERGPQEEFLAAHQRLCAQDKWIIEGSYLKLLEERVAAADTIIFLDIPRSTCIWRVLKRSVRYWRTVMPGGPEGCKEQLFHIKFLDFLKWVWDFDTRYRSRALSLLEEAAKEGKSVIILTSAKAHDDFIESLIANSP